MKRYNSEIRKQPYEYIRHLDSINATKRQQERNRLESIENRLSREAGFVVHFSGANRNAKLSQTARRAKLLGPRRRWVKQERRKWDEPKTPILCQDLEEIPPSFEQSLILDKTRVTLLDITQ